MFRQNMFQETSIKLFTFITLVLVGQDIGIKLVNDRNLINHQKKKILENYLFIYSPHVILNLYAISCFMKHERRILNNL